MRWCRYGESAIHVDLGVDCAEDRAARTHAAAAAVRARLGERVGEVVIGAGTLLVAGLAPGALCGIAEAITAALAGAIGRGAVGGRAHTIEVVYDGPDLEEVAAAAGTTPREVIAWHAGREVVVELLGFLPGFAYMGEIDPRLVRPRRASPRPVVPAGSVGIAGAFTGVYPFASPGGWSLLGRAVGTALFDPDRDPPSLLAPGDRVRFVRVAAGDVRSSTRVPAAPAAPETARALEILAAPAGATVQDGGRPGQLSRGLPPSGPLDVVGHAAANLAAGNAADAAAIEVPLGGLEVRAHGDLVVSVDGAPAAALRDGERLAVPAVACAVRYLAALGGAAVPARLGARATLLAARLGGLNGRPLRRGDRVPIGEPSGEAPATFAEPIEGALMEDSGEIEIDPGPHVDRFPPGAMEVLLGTTWRISRWSDRVGVRLEGGRVPREGVDMALPAPMLRGAVQVATDGTPIVLGPDHPITGGYPVLAVVRRAGQPRLARRRPGEEVRFRQGY